MRSLVAGSACASTLAAPSLTGQTEISLQEVAFVIANVAIQCFALGIAAPVWQNSAEVILG